jgi:hypothetical protein
MEPISADVSSRSSGLSYLADCSCSALCYRTRLDAERRHQMSISDEASPMALLSENQDGFQESLRTDNIIFSFLCLKRIWR